MTRGYKLLLTCAALGLVSTLTVGYWWHLHPSVTPQTPQQFLGSLYAEYDGTGRAGFSPFDDTSGVFEPDLVAMAQEDAKLLGDQVGVANDGDFICDCQDSTRITANVKVVSEDAMTATAQVDFSDDGGPTKHNVFSLVRVNGMWLIHDVDEIGQPSLRTLITNELTSLKGGGSGAQ